MMPLELVEQPLEVLNAAEHCTLLLYRLATYATLNMMDDAAILAFALS